MELYRSRLRKPRFTLAEVAGLVAGVALAMRFPVLIVPTLAVAHCLFCDRLGLSGVWCLVLAIVAGVVLGFSLPVIHHH